MKMNSSFRQAPSHPPERLSPDYYEDFSCLGGDCINTCCRDWPIWITKTDYKRIFQNLPQGAIRKTAKEALHRRPEGTSSAYAEVCLNEQGFCGFFDGEGLCSLQRKLGAGVLPAICRKFPRRSSLICSVREGYLQMGCEGVISLFVNRGEQPILLSMVEQELRDEQGAYWFREEDVEKSPILRSYWSAKALGIAILQNRFYTMEQRLLYLGTVMKTLREYAAEEKWWGVEGFLRQEMEKEDSIELKELLERFPSNSLAFIRKLAGISGLFSQGGHPPYRALMEEIKSNLAFVKEDTQMTCSILHCNRAKEGYDRFLERHPYLMEHIAVALFHSMALPIGGVSFQNGGPKTIDVWNNYVFFCAQLGVLRFVLMGLGADKLEDARLASVIATVLRTFPNKGDSGRRLAEELIDVSRPEMEQLSILIRGY